MFQKIAKHRANDVHRPPLLILRQPKRNNEHQLRPPFPRRSPAKQFQGPWKCHDTLILEDIGGKQLKPLRPKNSRRIRWRHFCSCPRGHNLLQVVVFDTLVFYLNEYFVELNKAKFKFLNWFLNWIFREKKLLNNFLNWIFLKKMILNNPLNWILPWNEWMNHILNRYLPFLMKSPLFCLFWTLFGQYFISVRLSQIADISFLTNLAQSSKFSVTQKI